MASEHNRPHENKGDQWELVENDWWRTFFNSVSWTYPPSQGSPSRRPSKRTTLLRLSRAGQLLKARLSRYPPNWPSDITAPMADELSRDLVGVRVVEEVLRSYESSSGFDMIERFLRFFDLGWVLDDEHCALDHPPPEEHRERWEEGLRKLFQESFTRLPEELYHQHFPPDHGEERLKDISPHWDSCLDNSTTLDDLIRSLEGADLTDSELSADSDPLPVTPRARHQSSSPLSACSLKPLSATASSFVPTPAKYSPSSISPSPSPSPPVLDIINFPTLRQTILSAPRKDDRDSKSRTKRQSVPSFLADKADARKSKTRQLVDKMKSAYDPRKPDEFIPVAEDSPPEDAFGPVEPVVKCYKKRSRRGRESISTVSTDDMNYSSSMDLSAHPQPPVTSPTRSVTNRPPAKNPKRASSLTMNVPVPTQTPPTPAFSSPAGSVSSFGGPVTPGPFAVQFPPPPVQQPPHPVFMQMQQRSPPFPTPFSYPYGLPGTGMIPPGPYPNAFAGPYPPPQFGGYLNGKSVITGSSGIRHASW